LTGEDWSTRVANSVVLDESGGETRIEYMRVEVQMQASSNSEIKEAVDGMLEVVEQSSGRYGMDARMYVTGDLVALTTVMQGLTTSQLESTGISLAVSFIVLLAITRRIGPAVMVITPVAVAAVWVVGGMALLNLNWNVLTVMVTALTIGLGIDYSIHVWQRFEVACSEGMDPWSALRETHATTGVALLLSAGTTICGFLVLRLSPMPVVQDFGIVTAMTVFFSLLLALGLLPILLVMDSKFENGWNGDSQDGS
jgi:predicted RND superfamily exporter protein